LNNISPVPYGGSCTAAAFLKVSLAFSRSMPFKDFLGPSFYSLCKSVLTTLDYTVWKFKDFSATQILREVKFDNFGAAKIAMLTSVDLFSDSKHKDFWNF